MNSTIWYGDGKALAAAAGQAAPWGVPKAREMLMRLPWRLARTASRHARRALSLVAAGGASAFMMAGPGDTASAQTGAAAGTPFSGTAAVGALFVQANGHLGRHFCTASVVHSPRGNLLITAAHCMAREDLRPAGHIVFAPGYHSGRFPHGTWQVSVKYVDKRWASERDPNDDVAFLVAARPGRHIERITGAETLDAGEKLPVRVHVIGYPDATRRPITCAGPARSYERRGLRQLVFDCGGYTAGTSGGPFLAHVSARTGDGSVIGVIGGYQQGGNTPSVSYSSQFLANVLALYKIATARLAAQQPS